MALSEHEQRLLDEIEQALYAEDPKFASSVRSARPRSRARTQLALAVCGALAGLAVVIIGLATKLIPLSVLGFVLIVGACVVAMNALRGPRASGPISITEVERGPSPRGTNLRSRMEDRMRRRFDEN